jgi:hypothetical protein
VSESCAHDDLEVGSSVDQLEEHGNTWLCIKLSVRCQSCNTLFSWSGVGSGLPNHLEPVVSADGYELRAPIVPRPGGTVGLLVRAGLEDRLLHPNQLEATADGT